MSNGGLYGGGGGSQGDGAPGVIRITYTPSGLAGAASLAFAATAAAVGNAAAGGAANLALAATAAIKGAGALVGSASLGLTAAASLKAAGALVGAAALAFTATGTPVRPSGLAGSAPLAFTATARPNGSSSLAGSGNIAFATSGALAGIAVAGGAADIAFTADGRLAAIGLLAGNGDLAFIAHGVPSASAALGGVASFAFTAAGTARALGATLPVDDRYYAALPARPFYAAMPFRSFYAMSDPNITPTLDAKDPNESVVVTLDATADLEDDEVLTEISKTEVVLVYGNDPDPSGFASDAQINGAPVTTKKSDGSTVTIATGKGLQFIAAGGIDGRYRVKFTCATSNADKTLVLKGILPVSAA